MLNADWHRKHLMPKNATARQRLEWHLEHEQQCGCRKLTAAQRSKLRAAVKKAAGRKR